MADQNQFDTGKNDGQTNKGMRQQGANESKESYNSYTHGHNVGTGKSK